MIVIKDGKPNFSEMQRRSLMSNKFRIEMAAAKLQVSFTAYDILYLDGKQITDLDLMERKKMLEKTIKENERLAISRYIEEKGIALYNLTVQQNLEGIVAKRKDSKYYFGKNTKDWIKIKYLKDEDFIVCGYIEKSNKVVSVILGQYKNDELIYKGHTTLGVSREDFNKIAHVKRIAPLFISPKGNEDAIWIEPIFVCTVKYMNKTESGGMRQPVFKGLRDDKSPYECIE